MLPTPAARNWSLPHSRDHRGISHPYFVATGTAVFVLPAIDSSGGSPPLVAAARVTVRDSLHGFYAGGPKRSRKHHLRYDS